MAQGYQHILEEALGAVFDDRDGGEDGREQEDQSNRSWNVVEHEALIIAPAKGACAYQCRKGAKTRSVAPSPRRLDCVGEKIGSIRGEPTSIRRAMKKWRQAG